MDSATRLSRDLTKSLSTRAAIAAGLENIAEDSLDDLDDEFERRTAALMEL